MVIISCNEIYLKCSLHKFNIIGSSVIDWLNIMKMQYSCNSLGDRNEMKRIGNFHKL